MDWHKLSGRYSIQAPGVLLALILLVALGLRLYGINWDEGHGFHPDERSIYMRADCMFRVLTEAPRYADCIADHPETEPGFPGPLTFLDADKSPLNPHWFPLGSVLIYIIVAVRLVFQPLVDLGSLSEMSYIGRSVTALADVGTVLMVYLLGRRVYGRRVGLLAAALVSLAVVHIQNSHFYRPEPILIFFVLASFWFMLQVMERRRLRDSLLLGLFVGLALAPKASVLPLLLPLALTSGFRLFTTTDWRWEVPSSAQLKTTARHALLAGAVAVGVFVVITPYALLDVVEFVGQNGWQAGMARTAGTVPFTVQYIGTTPFLYELRQTSLWALGLPLGIAAWGGLLFTVLKVSPLRTAARSGLKRGPTNRAELLFLAWVVPNFLLLASFEVKFMRYIFPLIPFLILMGSAWLFWLQYRARELSHFLRATGHGWLRRGAHLAGYAPHGVSAVIAFVVLATAIYALAFERIYSRPHTAVQASRWINENVPPNSTIVADNHWDEGIRGLHRYSVPQIPIYERDTVTKMGNIATLLSQGDYLVFYSNRTYGSVGRLPERYPMSSRYYQSLFAGELGYELEVAFTSYPQFLGIAFVDDTFTRARLPEPEALARFRPAPLTLNLGYADENVIDYDHPKVLLFRNVEGLSRSDLNDILTRAPLQPDPELGLMLSAEDKATQRQGGTWSQIVSRDSWTNDVPVLAWLLLVELIYVAALPLAMFLFRPLPDRGIVFAKLLGILGVSYVAWMLASVGWLGFSRASVLAGILAVALLSGIVLLARWRECKEFLVRNWRLLAIGEVIFLAAFLAFVAIRMANPDLWHAYRGGEKPMDFAYLNAVLRSTALPPYDPWYAGGYLNYYYWGQFIVATLVKGTGIIPSVAYNLAVPLLFALTVTGAYSLVYNVTAGLRRIRGVAGVAPATSGQGAFEEPYAGPNEGVARASSDPPDPRRWKWWARGVAWGPVAAGLLAGLLVAVMGNLDNLAQVVRGGWGRLFRGESFPSLDIISDFWRGSRMLPQMEDVSPSALTFWLPEKVGSAPDIGHHITEFPYFSFLFADLHAHMIAIPFTLLAAGLAFSLLVGLAKGRRSWLAPAAIALAVSVGALWAINSWDYPTYVLLAVVLIGVGAFLRPGKLSERLGLFTVLTVGTVLLSIVLFLPFHANYHPYPTGLDVSKWRTPLLNYMGIHGLFFFLLVSFLIVRWAQGWRGGFSLRRLWGLLLAPLQPALGMHGTPSFQAAPAPAWTWKATLRRVREASWTGVAVAVSVFVVIYLAAAGYWTAALLTALLAFTLWAARSALSEIGEGAVFSALPLVMLALALLIGIGVEFVRVEDDIGRMNTLFKYYLNAWVLFGVASGYLLWYLASKGAFRIRGMSPVRGVWLAMLVILIGANFLYPVLGTRSRLADRFNTQTMTLDGADYMRTATYSKEGPDIELRWDYEAITWLQDNVQGSPVVLEAHNTQYRWSSRIADYTGLPTVLGWPWHQIQQRMKYNYAVRERTRDVEEMYSTTDVKRGLELLRRYEVEYVVVGQLEQAYYPAQGLQKFDDMARQGLAEVVYQNDGTKIYQALWYN